jgi:hypothetical protein
MAPAADDPTIPSTARLMRVLWGKWSCIDKKTGMVRPTSDSMTDSNLENSTYIDALGESNVPEMQRLNPGLRIGIFTAELLRRNGYSLERRPAEADLRVGNPNSHVVTGPRDVGVGRVYERRAKAIVTDPSVQVIEPPEEA